MNEELRSATEELETSREELQSINEELTTVNQEMKSKMEEIAHANSDLQNLMASTSIATVFLDRNLVITRFTPSAVEIFHLIPGDLGRPLADLKHQLEYPDLIQDAENVLRTLVPVEREVKGNGRWFLARIQPYRTLEDKIAGAVFTFVDITERKQASEELRQQLTELERFNQAANGREGRMIELKKEINQMCARLGEAPRYNINFDVTGESSES
jgi:two-component system CheB/CheR fusion protein